MLNQLDVIFFDTNRVHEKKTLGLHYAEIRLLYRFKMSQFLASQNTRQSWQQFVAFAISRSFCQQLKHFFMFRALIRRFNLMCIVIGQKNCFGLGACRQSENTLSLCTDNLQKNMKQCYGKSNSEARVQGRCFCFCRNWLIFSHEYIFLRAPSFAGVPSKVCFISNVRIAVTPDYEYFRATL